MLMGPLKRDLLDFYLSTSFVVGNFGNTKAMRVIFFENVRKLKEIRKMQKKIEKKSFVFDINASSLFAFNCVY